MLYCTVVCRVSSYSYSGVGKRARTTSMPLPTVNAFLSSKAANRPLREARRWRSYLKQQSKHFISIKHVVLVSQWNDEKTLKKTPKVSKSPQTAGRLQGNLKTKGSDRSAGTIPTSRFSSSESRAGWKAE